MELFGKAMFSLNSESRNKIKMLSSVEKEEFFRNASTSISPINLTLE